MYKRFLEQHITHYNRKWYCYICKLTLESIAKVEHHLQEAHQNINNKISGLQNLSNEKCKQLLHHGIVLKNISQDYYFCLPCHCSLPSLNHIDMHLIGKRHTKCIQKNVKIKNKQQDSHDKPVCKTELVQDLSNNCIQMTSKTSINDYVSYPLMQEVMCTNFFIQNITRYGQWYCSKCKSPLQNLAEAECHLQEVHPNNTKILDFSSDSDELLDTEKYRKLLNDEISQNYFCSVCQCLISLNNFEEHFKGKRHTKCIQKNAKIKNKQQDLHDKPVCKTELVQDLSNCIQMTSKTSINDYVSYPLMQEVMCKNFVPSGGSNLAAIFGLKSKLPDPYSVTQTAPKKTNTRYNIQQTTPSPKTEVLIAKAVHAFKLQNGHYVSIGKYGIALTGNVTTKLYQIILYKSKQEYISVATVTHDFVYIIQAHNYASYYDNNKDNWSILFENNENYLEFAIEVGLARYFVMQERRENVVYQDLMPSSKDVIAKEGDNICIKYFVGTEIVQPFKTNFVMSQTMTVEISTDENWERILLGTGKGLKRVLFLPPSKQISLGPGFPKERDIMLIIEIMDICVSEENPPASKSSSGKAAIISRMAKMGQSILPKMPVLSTTDSEDTEDDVPHKPHHKKIEQSEGSSQKKNFSHELEEKRAARKIVETKTEMSSIDSSMYKPLVAAPPLTQQWAPPYYAGHYVTMDNQMYPLQQTVNRTIPTALDPGINMLLSETRVANAEIRMGMSKISDNVQKLLDKFHALELQNATTPTIEKTTLDTSWKMLLALNASQAAIKDNELSKSIAKEDTSDEKVQEAQNRINTLENDLEKSQEEKKSLLQINKDLNKNLQELETKLADTSDELKKTKEALEVAKNTIKQCKDENVRLEDKLSECNKEHVLQADAIFSKQKDIEQKNKEIKQIMNKTYHTLLERLADESRFELSFDYVKLAIANTIKHITLQVLYEDPDEEGNEFKTNKDTSGMDIKIIDQQIGKPVLNVISDSISIDKRSDTSTSAMVIPVFENEPPPVPPDGIDELDSD